jgi:histidinol dehydrogenase
VNDHAPVLTLRTLDSSAPGFDAALNDLIAFEAAQDPAIDAVVAAIIADVRRRGDAALLDYTERFDRLRVARVADLAIDRGAMRAAYDALADDERNALQTAARRIRDFHERQKAGGFSFRDANGTELGQRITPLDRVGLYVPGGKAAYPSSVLMNAIPAQVAGVADIVMVVPTPDGARNPLVLAAAHIAGVTRAYTIGGAQAIASLAYGTETIPAVDKICGPGNAYVAAAKRRVFGTVGIDMVAGVSEILVLADASANPDWVAIDLFSQAEHDEMAQAILLTPDAALIDRVAHSAQRWFSEMSRASIIAASFAHRGALIKTRDLAEACAIANRVAPEHLELAVADPDALLPQLRHAGAIFIGHYASEALGDYCAGPNHVLPTGRTARFSSPLGVYDFQKRTSILRIDRLTAQALAPVAATLAMGEGLPAHARAAEVRMSAAGEAEARRARRRASPGGRRADVGISKRSKEADG